MNLTVYCGHVNSNHVHCNRYTVLNIDVDETPRDAIEDSEWGLVDGEPRCHECYD